MQRINKILSCLGLSSKIVIGFAVIVFLLSLFVGNNSGISPQDTIKVGLSADYPPFEFFEGGEIVGLDVDIVKKISEDLDLQLNLINMDFSALIPALVSGKIDMAASSMSYTPERAGTVDFSEVYFRPDLAVVFNSKSKFKTFDSLKSDPKSRVSAQLGSVMEDYAKKNLGDSKVISLTDNNSILQELKLMRIDAFIIDELQAIEFCKKNRDLFFLRLNQNGDSEDGYVIALKKGSNLTEKVNKSLKNMVDSGEMEKIRNKWINNES